MSQPLITLASCFDPEFEGVKFDAKLMQRLYRFQISFLNKNEEHLAFFGSNLIGVHVVSWRTSDTLRFFHDVLQVDYQKLEKRVRTATTIVHEYAISGDILNLTLMYLIHRILTATGLKPKEQERGAYDTALIFFYRCIVIRQDEWFHFPADPKVAQAAYANLTNQFLIKKLGSWKAVMEYRAKELLADVEKPGHRRALMVFQNDLAVVYAISDSENRIRDMYKNYYSVFNDMHEQGTKIGSSSSTQVDLEGVEQLKEKVKSTEHYVNVIRQVIADRPDFLHYELISVVLDLNKNTSQRMLVATLSWLSDEYNKPKHHAQIDEFIRLVIVHSFHLLREFNLATYRDYPTILVQLKNLYLSTRSSDADLIRIRKLGESLIKAANGRTNSSLAMATRTAVILYLTIRALTAGKV